MDSVDEKLGKTRYKETENKEMAARFFFLLFFHFDLFLVLPLKTKDNRTGTCHQRLGLAKGRP